MDPAGMGTGMTEQGMNVGLLPGRDCGTCSLCCKVMAIGYMDPPKPAGKWCQHCTPGQGCAVWAERPQGCADFNCDWRKNPRLPDAWRPDRCGFVIHQQAPHMPIEINVDPGRPDAWRKEPYYSALKQAAQAEVANRGSIVVLVGARQWLMLPDSDVPIPAECIGGDFRISRDTPLLGGKWRVTFSPPSKD